MPANLENSAVATGLEKISFHSNPKDRQCQRMFMSLCWHPVTSTTGHCFHFGFVSSFFLELFLHWSPVAYWAPTDLGSSSFSILSFCLFILFMGFSRQECSGLPFPSLSEFSTVYVIHTVKGFGIVNKGEVDVFLELSLFQWSSSCWQFDLWFLSCVRLFVTSWTAAHQASLSFTIS